jgi:hypothetical protein
MPTAVACPWIAADERPEPAAAAAGSGGSGVSKMTSLSGEDPTSWASNTPASLPNRHRGRAVFSLSFANS